MSSLREYQHALKYQSISRCSVNGLLLRCLATEASYTYTYYAKKLNYFLSAGLNYFHLVLTLEGVYYSDLITGKGVLLGSVSSQSGPLPVIKSV